MARKAANTQGSGKDTAADVEQGIVRLAEQLGGFLGRVQRRADGLMDNEALKTQIAQIRDGANSLLKQVNASGAAVKKSAAKVVAAVKPTMKVAKRPRLQR